ncbi:MAG: Flp pilus assembly protein TadD [Myxococcota bacterium]|jgi:Flp pilus assembly protein TadD
MTSINTLLSYANEGRFLAAADLLLEAFRNHPEDPHISRELGKVLRSVGDLEGAITYLKRSWQHDSASPATVAELILALHEMHREGEATQVMLRSLEAGLDETEFANSIIAGA